MATPVSSSNSTASTVWGIIVGGGSGTRFGSEVPKQFLELGDRWVIEWSIATFFESHEIDQFVVVVPSERVEECSNRWQEYTPKLHAIIAGGKERFDSVSNALACLPPDARYVLIHDAARPGVTQQIISDVISATIANGAALPVLPVAATVKEVHQDFVTQTIDRSILRLAQTPQGFRIESLRNAIQNAGTEIRFVTDEIQLVERLADVQVKAVLGSKRNEKITTIEDLTVLSMQLHPSAVQNESVSGIGYDVHQFQVGRDLILGGIKFDHPVGLLGHSDADVLCHAIADALLGAATLGDIGQHFPDTDVTWKGADSIMLLGEVRKLLLEAAHSIAHIDATLLLEAPKVMKRSLDMRTRIAEALQIDVRQISIKATTNETMGFVGRKEGAAAMAVATLRRVCRD